MSTWDPHFFFFYECMNYRILEIFSLSVRHNESILIKFATHLYVFWSYICVLEAISNINPYFGPNNIFFNIKVTVLRSFWFVSKIPKTFDLLSFAFTISYVRKLVPATGTTYFWYAKVLCVRALLNRLAGCLTDSWWLVAPWCGECSPHVTHVTHCTCRPWRGGAWTWGYHSVVLLWRDSFTTSRRTAALPTAPHSWCHLYFTRDQQDPVPVGGDKYGVSVNRWPPCA